MTNNARPVNMGIVCPLVEGVKRIAASVVLRRDVFLWIAGAEGFCRPFRNVTIVVGFSERPDYQAIQRPIVGDGA